MPGHATWLPHPVPARPTASCGGTHVGGEGGIAAVIECTADTRFVALPDRACLRLDPARVPPVGARARGMGTGAGTHG